MWAWYLFGSNITNLFGFVGILEGLEGPFYLVENLGFRGVWAVDESKHLHPNLLGFVTGYTVGNDKTCSGVHKMLWHVPMLTSPRRADRQVVATLYTGWSLGCASTYTYPRYLMYHGEQPRSGWLISLPSCVSRSTENSPRSLAVQESHFCRRLWRLGTSS
jgi:hypothetical protein